MDERMELAGVEMPPLSLGGVVVAGQFTATLRAVPAAAFRVLDVDVDRATRAEGPLTGLSFGGMTL